MSKNSDSWCPEIYRGLFLHPVGKNAVGVAPCCQADTQTTVNSEFDFLTDTYLDTLRTQSKPAACHRCWHTEDLGGYSKRQSSIDFYKKEPSNQIELNALEYNVVWACNLACIMCGPQNSSSWARELNVTDQYDRADQTKNDIIKKLDKSKLSRIHFNGGEPLINDEHIKLLDQVEVLDQCKITYNTNGTCLPSDRVLAAWEKSKMVRLFFSIDATADAFEYVRWPGRWATIQNNVQWFIDRSPSNVMFGLNVTVGTYNVLELADLHDWYLTAMPKNREGDQSDFCWQIAYNFDPRWAIEDVKQEVIDVLKNREPFDSLIAYLENTKSHESDSWTHKLDTIDHRRKLDWRAVLKIGKYYQ